MILIVDMNWKKESLGYYEFVEPLIAEIPNKKKVRVKHYKEIKAEDIANIDKIVLSGNALKDSEFLKEPDRFVWKYADIPLRASVQVCKQLAHFGLPLNVVLKLA